MSNLCVKCMEAWDFDDYVCPCCGGCAIEQDSDFPVTLEYKTFSPSEATQKEHPGAAFEYDVIRLSNGKSVFDEPQNYMNKD